MKKLYFLLFTFLITSLSFGQVILTETFTYTDGSLLGNGAWVSHSGVAGDLLVSSGQAVIQHGTPSEDINLPYTPVAGNVYFGLDITVMDPGNPIPGTDDEYFVHFSDGGTSNFRSRVDLVAAPGGGDFTVGISTNTSTAQATWGSDLTYGVTYRLTVRYDQVANISELWVDASAEGDTSILGTDQPDVDAEIASSVAFRQSDSADNEGILVDNLVVAQSFAETVLGTKENQIEGFKFSPNPTSLGYVNISSRSQIAMKVNVFDILGKQVINSLVANNRLDVSSLNAGVYIMRVSQDNATTTKKLVIQ